MIHHENIEEKYWRPVGGSLNKKVGYVHRKWGARHCSILEKHKHRDCPILVINVFCQSSSEESIRIYARILPNLIFCKLSLKFYRGTLIDLKTQVCQVSLSSAEFNKQHNPTIPSQARYVTNPVFCWLVGWIVGCWLAGWPNKKLCHGVSTIRFVPQLTNNTIRATVGQHLVSWHWPTIA